MPTGTGTAVPVAVASPNEFTVASFNMERLFDTINDPDIGDVALTPAAYELRLRKATLAIRDVMRMPDIVGVEEVETQEVLQDSRAAAQRDSDGGGDIEPCKYVAYLEEGNDSGGHRRRRARGVLPC